jgi:hypothetical protein
MQTYPLKLSPTVTSIPIGVQGDLFVYESGDAGAGDSRICVKPENGAEIILKPGQRFRIKGTAQRWNVSLKDATSNLTANIIIGEGEFDDANTLNKFTLDATLTNNVTVDNTPANRVPVSLDTSQILNVAGDIVSYTHKYSSITTAPSGTAVNLLPAATNINGAVLNKFEVIAGSASGIIVVVLANANTPANLTDGDVLWSGFTASATMTRFELDIAKNGQIKVPAGKGIWYMADASDGCRLRDALFTVL